MAAGGVVGGGRVGLLRPVARRRPLRVDRFYAALGRPIILKGRAGRKVALDLVQGHHPANVGRKQLVSDALHLTTELKIRQVPSINLKKIMNHLSYNYNEMHLTQLF